jgi:hydrogenase nickel incorporation protein HypA/HybF
VKRVTAGNRPLSQVEVSAMRFAFEVVRAARWPSRRELDIVETDGTAWCMRLFAGRVIASAGEACPQCGSWQLQITGGDRMRVLDIEID